ncbi:hypothetical protein [Herbidospora mongoliensis]|uniref:hypothetical protein n=1 Tax=Herbidospora mongoliensis TaxID=688067 RepID=UPI000836EB2D|nr:hypothetical protein [Herbidospora mongoliensis]
MNTAYLGARRIVTLILAAALLIQGITAGLLLASPGGRGIHRATAILVVLAAIASLVVAIMTKDRKQIIPAVMILLLVFLQMYFGFAHFKALHVPIGMIMFGGVVHTLGILYPSRRDTPVAA